MNKRKLLIRDRYADPITMDHVIELRKQLEQVTKERDNALSMCVELARQKKQLNDKVWSLTDQEKRENP
jgi:hypothetical protein